MYFFECDICRSRGQKARTMDDAAILWNGRVTPPDHHKNSQWNKHGAYFYCAKCGCRQKNKTKFCAYCGAKMKDCKTYADYFDENFPRTSFQRLTAVLYAAGVCLADIRKIHCAKKANLIVESVGKKLWRYSNDPRNPKTMPQRIAGTHSRQAAHCRAAGRCNRHQRHPIRRRYAAHQRRAAVTTAAIR